MPGKRKPVIVHRDECPLERTVPTGTETVSPVTWRTLLSADRTGSEKISCGVTDIPADDSGRSYIRHSHEEPEVYYILAGQGLVLIDGTEYPVREGCAVFIPENTEHAMKSTGNKTLSLLYIFPADSFSDIIYRYPDETEKLQ